MDIDDNRDLELVLGRYSVKAVDRAALRAVDDAFVARISKHIEEHGPIPEVPGAKDFVSRLAESGDCQIAYATFLAIDVLSPSDAVAALNKKKSKKRTGTQGWGSQTGVSARIG